MWSLSSIQERIPISFPALVIPRGRGSAESSANKGGKSHLAGVQSNPSSKSAVIIPEEGGWLDIAEQLKQRRADLEKTRAGDGCASLATTPRLGSSTPSGLVGTAAGDSSQKKPPNKSPGKQPLPSSGGDVTPEAHRSALPGARRSCLGPLLNHLRRAAEAEGASELPGRAPPPLSKEPLLI